MRAGRGACAMERVHARRTLTLAAAKPILSTKYTMLRGQAGASWGGNVRCGSEEPTHYFSHCSPAPVSILTSSVSSARGGAARCPVMRGATSVLGGSSPMSDRRHTFRRREANARNALVCIPLENVNWLVAMRCYMYAIVLRFRLFEP